MGLDKWFVAVWAIANCRNGISSHESARAIGVTQKTAWFMLHRIRDGDGVQDRFDKFDGPAEADTSYVGGKAENMHAKRREKVIQGPWGSWQDGRPWRLATHNGRRAKPSRRGRYWRAKNPPTCSREVRSRVRYGATVYTDSALAYGDLCLTHVHQDG